MVELEFYAVKTNVLDVVAVAVFVLCINSFLSSFY